MTVVYDHCDITFACDFTRLICIMQISVPICLFSTFKVVYLHLLILKILTRFLSSSLLIHYIIVLLLLLQVDINNKWSVPRNVFVCKQNACLHFWCLLKQTKLTESLFYGHTITLAGIDCMSQDVTL